MMVREAHGAEGLKAWVWQRVAPRCGLAATLAKQRRWGSLIRRGQLSFANHLATPCTKVGPREKWPATRDL
eukprot:scaffold5006_cov116-Isochrysis_galbana.AAC.2